MLNVDDRFAKTPGYLFGAMSMVEAERLRANANLTGMKGKRSAGPGGLVSYQLEDPCSVFEKIPGTPKYWQRVKYEIIAKLENIGPFQVQTGHFLITSINAPTWVPVWGLGSPWGPFSVFEFPLDHHFSRSPFSVFEA